MILLASKDGEKLSDYPAIGHIIVLLWLLLKIWFYLVKEQSIVIIGVKYIQRESLQIIQQLTIWSNEHLYFHPKNWEPFLAKIRKADQNL